MTGPIILWNALRWAGRGARRMLAWLIEEPLRLVAVVLAGVLAWQYLVAMPALRASRDEWRTAAGKWQRSSELWQAAHGQLVADVRSARAEAAAADKANVARVEREFSRINERTADAYEARLADTRAAADRLRDELATAAAGDPGGGRGADVPQAYTARCRAFGAADCDALLAALPDQLSAAEENTGKLIELQDYVRSMLAIDFSGAAE